MNLRQAIALHEILILERKFEDIMHNLQATDGNLKLKSDLNHKV